LQVDLQFGLGDDSHDGSFQYLENLV